MTTRMLLGLMAGLCLSAAPVLAHRDFAAEFDANKPVTLNGTTTKSAASSYQETDAAATTGKQIPAPAQSDTY